VELPQGLAGCDSRLFFERGPLPKPRTRIFCLGMSTPETAYLMLLFALIMDLGIYLVSGKVLHQRFPSPYIGYFPATANEHYQYGFSFQSY